MSQLILQRDLLEAKEGDPVHTLAQARTSTAILRLDAEHNENVIRFLSDSGLTEGNEATASLLNGIDLDGADLGSIDLEGADLRDTFLIDADLSGAELDGADLSGAFLFGANLTDATGITDEELEQQADTLKGATMPNGQKYEEWLNDREGRREDGG